MLERTVDLAQWSHVHGLSLVTQGEVLEEWMMHGPIDQPILMELACRAMDLTYAPYSKFTVGAVMYCYDGEQSYTFSGANIENSSYGLTICAERVAIFNTVLADKQIYARMIVLATDTNRPASPCGACRQVMAEFFKHDLEVLSIATRSRRIMSWTLDELLPEPFKL